MLIVPKPLAAACRGTRERSTWLELLPHAIRELQDRWSLSLGAPFDGGDGNEARQQFAGLHPLPEFSASHFAQKNFGFSHGVRLSFLRRHRDPEPRTKETVLADT